MFIWSSIAHFIALTSPGPDTAIIIRQVTLHGRKSGFIAALGIGFGISVHCFLAISGISLFILSNDLYKLLISIFGSSYLIYLSIMMLKTSKNIASSTSEDYKPLNSFATGFITNIFNIKAFIFFVSLFTILIESIDGIYFYLYPIYFSITSCLWFVLVSYMLSLKNNSFNIHENKIIKYIMSLLLCIIGLLIFFRSVYEYF
ncbi:LysE family translocator [Gammaproteobacteria bacterium]|nr:LysE family translocator [Gammaproteobacteria bacterium]MDB4238070.1 LysE family translocator [Gammaproteobacteria bacterium]MDC0124656.1 LysE family translocator [Gammaproteobacteria bacterium]